MGFATELEAVHVLRNNFSPSNFARNRTLLAQEFTIGFGVADLVFLELVQGARSAITKSILSDTSLGVLRLFQNDKSLTAQQISCMAHISLRTAKDKMRELVELGYLEASEKSFRQKKKYKPIINKVIAIEVKLHNWKRALIQAFKYLVFANQSYVAMDADYVHRAKVNMDEFRKSNVGLVSISFNGKIERIYTPVWRHSRRDLAFFQVNERAKKLIQIEE